MPNLFAQLVLYSFPVAVYVLFRLMPKHWAIATSMLAGYLLLPTRAGIDLPALPAITKDALPVLSVGLMLLLGVGRKGTDDALPSRGKARGRVWFFGLVALLAVVSPVLMTLTNPEPLVYGPVTIPGMRPYDTASVILTTSVLLLPFFIARRHFVTTESHVTLLKAVTLSMLLYSLPTLFEVRMSPQLNTMIYGFFPHDFIQHIRAGGFRPLVFLQHGLWLAIIFAMAIISAVALWRHRLSEGGRSQQWLFAAIYLLVVLVLCRSLGALALALLALPVALLAGVRFQLLVAGVVGAAVLIYPMLRGAGIAPVDDIVEIFASVDAERAGSLQFRLDNEDALLERAAEKPLAGWGTWGRNMIYDPETGRSTSITDGAWVITIGTAGWLGYIGQFGLLTVPILMMSLHRRSQGATPATAGLALVLAVNLVDLIPNATLTPITWLIAGALAGRYAFGHQADETIRTPAPAGPVRSWALVTDAPPPTPTPRPTPTATVAAAAPGPTQGGGARAGRPRRTPV